MTRSNGPEPAIVADRLGKSYLLARRPANGALLDRVAGVISRRDSSPQGAKEVWAVRDISFEVPKGEIFGVIGRNGSGKTSLLKLLARVTAPTEGSATIRGRVAALLAVGAGFHPQLTGRDNIALSGAILGMSADEVQERFDAIVDFSEIGRYLDQPVKSYSSGMFVRLAYSVAAFLPAEIVLIDEVLAVGDADFREKSQAHMKQSLRDGRTVVYVGHGLDIVRDLCSEAIVLEEGHVVFRGSSDEAVDYYEQEIVGHPHKPRA